MKIVQYTIGKSPFGRGLFATQLIENGQEILEFKGGLIRFDELMARQSLSMNALQIGRNVYLDLHEPSVLVNHSCEPNAGVSPDFKLIAIKNINAGEEIFYDYSTVMFERFETMQCSCGHSKCRKNIGDFDKLPLGIRRSYLRIAIVPSFVIGELLLEMTRQLQCIPSSAHSSQF